MTEVNHPLADELRSCAGEVDASGMDWPGQSSVAALMIEAADWLDGPAEPAEPPPVVVPSFEIPHELWVYLTGGNYGGTTHPGEVSRGLVKQAVKAGVDGE